MPKKYYVGRGSFEIADLDANGNPKKFYNPGETPMFQIATNPTFIDNTPTDKAVNNKDLHLLVNLETTLSMQCKEIGGENLALFTAGTRAAQNSQVVTGAPFSSSTIQANEVWALPNGAVNVSNAVITDSAATPATLVAGTDYDLDAVYGTIKFKNVTGKTQPFKFSGTVGAAEVVGIATAQIPNKFVRFKGIILTISARPIIADFYNVSFSPAKNIMLKTGENNLTTFDLDADVLENTDRPADLLLGRTGRIVLLEP